MPIFSLKFPLQELSFRARPRILQVYWKGHLADSVDVERGTLKVALEVYRWKVVGAG